MSVEGAALAARRLPPAASRPVLTNFYPLYDGANDQVDPVTAVRRVFFQQVIPRYRLSTSETRDQGLGPDFIYAPVRDSSRYRRSDEAGANPPRAENFRAGKPDTREGAGSSAGSYRNRSLGTNLYRLDLPAPEPWEPWLGRRANLYV